MYMYTEDQSFIYIYIYTFTNLMINTFITLTYKFIFPNCIYDKRHEQVKKK